MFSPSLVAKRNPISSGSAPTSRANCPRTSSVFCSISSSGIGFDTLRSAKARAASATGSGNRRDVGGVQVEAVAHDGEIAADAKRIVLIVLPDLAPQRQERRGAGRDFDELSSVEIHTRVFRNERASSSHAMVSAWPRDQAGT